MSVASAGPVGVSRTVTLTLYGLPAAAVELIVPVMRPVPVLIDRPVGRLVAPYTSVSPSRSVAPASRLMTAPSAWVWLGTSWSNVGSRFTLVTVHWKVSVASTVGPSRTVTDTLYGLPAAAVNAMVPVMRPVPVSMLRPAGRPAAA